MSNAVDMIARCRAHSLGPPLPYQDLTAEDLKAITPIETITVLIGTTLTPSDPGVEGHGAFEMPVPCMPMPAAPPNAVVHEDGGD